MKPDDNISPATRLCAVIAMPVGHSLSPVLQFEKFTGTTALQEMMRRVVMEKLVP